MKRIIIAGGRDFNNADMVEACLHMHTKGLQPGDVQIVSGAARGADSIGMEIAKKYETNLAIFPAQWNTHGKSAGYKRNVLMAENADMLLAFWDGNSRGTKHMIDIAKQKGLVVEVFNY